MTPFEGMAPRRHVTDASLRGELVCGGGKRVGTPRGRYVRRPTKAVAA